MSRVSDSLYDANIAKPAAAGNAANNAVAIRLIIDALRAAGVIKDDASVVDA